MGTCPHSLSTVDLTSWDVCSGSSVRDRKISGSREAIGTVLDERTGVYASASASRAEREGTIRTRARLCGKEKLLLVRICVMHGMVDQEVTWVKRSY